MSSATVLIVDDSPDIRVILKRLLTSKGYRVVEAANGHQAVQVARRCCPQLVITDLGLPGMDGWEVARHIRTDPALEETPIIAMTGYGLASTLRSATHAGCQRVLQKPFELEELEREVTALTSISPSLAGKRGCYFEDSAALVGDL
jgi:CheY-like chemotaxis protein